MAPSKERLAEIEAHEDNIVDALAMFIEFCNTSEGDVVLRANDSAHWLAAALAASEQARERLQRERDDWGPFFLRDMARLAGLPDDADMNSVAAGLEAVEQARAQAEKALDKVLGAKWNDLTDEEWEQIESIRRRKSAALAAPGGEERAPLRWGRCPNCRTNFRLPLAAAGETEEGGET